MPRLTTYALDVETVQKISGELIFEVSKIIGCPSEYVTLQANQDLFIRDGKAVKGDPFVEICLFERGEEKEDLVAKAITELFARHGIPAVDIYLTHLSRRRYYEDGEHF